MSSQTDEFYVIRSGGVTSVAFLTGFTGTFQPVFTDEAAPRSSEAREALKLALRFARKQDAARVRALLPAGMPGVSVEAMSDDRFAMKRARAIEREFRDEARSLAEQVDWSFPSGGRPIGLFTAGRVDGFRQSLQKLGALLAEAEAGREQDGTR